VIMKKSTKKRKPKKKSPPVVVLVEQVKRKPRKTNLRSWLVNKLRRISYQFPERKQAIKDARVERGKYKCAKCEGIFKPGEFQLDHVIPVIDPHEGFMDWNNFIERLFCDVSGWNILCLNCHNIKTLYENEIRRQVKKETMKVQEEDDI
jgi:5-methylcytosine-specific restriction endonuclease McrA